MLCSLRLETIRVEAFVGNGESWVEVAETRSRETWARFRAEVEAISLDREQSGMVRAWALDVAKRVLTFEVTGGDEPVLAERIGPIAISANPDLGLISLELVRGDGGSMAAVMTAEEIRAIQPQLDRVGQVLLVQPPDQEEMQEALVRLIRLGIFNASLDRR